MLTPKWNGRWSLQLFLLIWIMMPDVIAAKKYNDFVNLFIGTSGDNGQVDPGAAVPFGMVRVCPDSDPRSHAGYDYSVDKISGISVNRLSGVGCSGAGGNLSVRPATPDFDLRIDKRTERAFPGYYETGFNNGVKAALTATRNIAVERYIFPKETEQILTVNIGASFERVIEETHSVTAPDEMEGYVVAPNVCGKGQYKLYFNLKTNKPFSFRENANRQITLAFGQSESNPVEVRIALSSVSLSAARNENQLIGPKSFESLRKQAARLWDEKLSKISVKGARSEQAIFYTSLYRVYLSPANVTSSEGLYTGTDGKVHEATEMNYYSSWSLWDTYRTKFPLLALMEPHAMSEMSQSLVRLYQTGKEDWSTRSEATPTVRTEHAMILLLDAFQKGIKGIDFRACYSQMCKEAARLPLNSPDQKLESACDLWALAQIADILGEKEDAVKYRTQSEQLFEKTWKKEFMQIDSSFTRMRDNGLYQGSRWQYRWAAPQYLSQMIEWVGGSEKLKQQLSYFFENHLYNQGNEPDIHVPYLFNRVGAPELTQQCVRSILTEEMIHKYGGNAEFPKPYLGKAYKDSPEGFMPEMDEDDGTMGAWYAFSAMGIYPSVVGVPEYDITSPLFDRVILKLDNGKTFRIISKNRKYPTDPVRAIYLNGVKFEKWQIPHERISNGGVLELRY